MSVTVTEVLDGGWFYVQIKSDELEQLQGLMEQLQRVEKKQPPGYSPKTGDYSLAKFAEDNQYYRAVIRGFTEKREYRVFYIDYGNTEVVPLSYLAPIDEAFLQLPHQAKECALACIRVPKTNEEFGREAALFFKDHVWGKSLWANVEYREQDRSYVSLGDPSSHVLVNASLVRSGLARVEKRVHQSLIPMANKLREEEELAKRSHLNIWQYGDISDDEDEVPSRGRRGRRGGRS